ncbi:MAG: hypothetical protein ACP5C4_06555 [Methanomicrobiales archaeon]
MSDILPIIQVRQQPSGLQIWYLDGDDTRTTVCTHDELISHRINVAQLVDHPDYYGYDAAAGGVVRTDFCDPGQHR